MSKRGLGKKGFYQMQFGTENPIKDNGILSDESFSDKLAFPGFFFKRLITAGVLSL